MPKKSCPLLMTALLLGLGAHAQTVDEFKSPKTQCLSLIHISGLVSAFCLLLKVVQSELLRQPVDVPEAPVQVTALLLRLSAPENVSGES